MNTIVNKVSYNALLLYRLQSIVLLLCLEAKKSQKYTGNLAQFAPMKLVMQAALIASILCARDSEQYWRQKKLQIPITTARYTKGLCQSPAVSSTEPYPTPAQ